MNSDSKTQLATFALVVLALVAGCAPRQASISSVTRQQVTVERSEAVPKTGLPTVAIITTGGTIAQKYDPEAGGLVPAVSGAELVEAVPELRKLAKLRVIPLVNIDSRDMTPELWLRLARLVRQTLTNPSVAGVVVTHGTDTMEETAYFLELTVNSDKPVVLTGAQRAASARDADGPRNLLNAVRQVVDPEARGRGVTVNFDSKIYYARPVTKSHTNHVSAFTAGPYGLAGELDDEGVTWFNRPERRQTFPVPGRLPRVELLYVYPGADGSLIDSAVANGAAGLVTCGYGIGNVNLPTFEAIKRARARKIPVVVTTRVPQGRVYPVYGGAGGGTSLKDLGVIFAGDLLPWKARILLMLALATTDDPAEIQRCFDWRLSTTRSGAAAFDRL